MRHQCTGDFSQLKRSSSSFQCPQWLRGAVLTPTCRGHVGSVRSRRRSCSSSHTWPWGTGVNVCSGLDTLERNQTAALYLFIVRPPTIPPPRSNNLGFSMPAPSFFATTTTAAAPPAGEFFQRCEHKWQRRLLKWQDQAVCRVTCQPPPGLSSPDLLSGPCMQLLLLPPHALCVPNVTTLTPSSKIFTNSLLALRLILALCCIHSGNPPFSSFVWSALGLCNDNRQKLKKPSPLFLLLAENNVQKWKCSHPHYLESSPICAQMSRIKAVKKISDTVQKGRRIIKLTVGGWNILTEASSCSSNDEPWEEIPPHRFSFHQKPHQSRRPTRRSPPASPFDCATLSSLRAATLPFVMREQGASPQVETTQVVAFREQ